ncbi:hypothetical protein INT47_004224 [Mucor saturninus]|uniref:Uncharacterized protein n=1 Tax=Mucor saturninus TaxID=64648 RepID=A0A8H7RAB8_9FUNG|nr:hypothetical protein INT47_004224 [Mucor saturninus]
MPDEKDEVSAGQNKSIGSRIKQHAQDVYNDKVNDKWNKRKTWKALGTHIQQRLKEVEKLATNNIKETYCLWLRFQLEYAMTADEQYFEVYAFMYVDIWSLPLSILTFIF